MAQTGLKGSSVVLPDCVQQGIYQHRYMRSWPMSPRDLPASASSAPGLQTHATILNCFMWAVGFDLGSLHLSRSL